MNIALETNYLNNVSTKLRNKGETILADSVIYHTEEINKKFNLLLNE